MARLEYIRHIPHRAAEIDSRIVWKPVQGGVVIDDLPQLVWANGTPWREANLWALERAATRDVSLLTVQSDMTALHAYSNWLEDAGANWWEFPMKRADRCLIRYRGALISARDKGEIAPSTASQRMGCVVKFYRWLHGRGFLSPEIQLWSTRSVPILVTDRVGFERTILVNSTDLAIPNRSTSGEKLEDGLFPVSANDRDTILSFARENSSEELFLMLSLGFFTGMRLGTLASLKVETLERAVPDSASPSLFRLAVGPGADPAVRTKFGVTKNYGPFVQTAQRFDIHRLLQKWVVRPEGSLDVRSLAVYFSMVGYVGMAYLLNFSLMRIEEGWSLRANCLEIEKDQQFGALYLLRGKTTKTVDDEDARWPTSPSVKVAVDAMKCVAGLRMICAQANPDVPTTAKDIENPYLVLRAYEPWGSCMASEFQQPLSVRPGYLTYLQVFDEAFPNLFDREQLEIKQEDLQIARLVTPTLDAEKFVLGSVWPLAWHQLRRTGAVNMQYNIVQLRLKFVS